MFSRDLIAPDPAVTRDKYPVMLILAENIEKGHIFGCFRNLWYERMSDVIDITWMQALKFVRHAEDILVYEYPVELGLP
jgi:hypothetical protein